MSAVSFNIKVTVEVEPPTETPKEVPKVSPINKTPLKDYKKFYCDACNKTMSVASVYNHVRNDKHALNVRKMLALSS